MQQRDKVHSRFLNYLKDPSNQQQSFATRKQVRFLLTFLGEMFIKGYRIQQFGSQATIILSLNDLNNQILPYSQIQANKKFVRNYEYLPKFIIVALQLDNNYISKHREQRLYLYKRLKKIHEFLQDPTQIYIIYLQSRLFAKLLPEQLQNTSAPDVKGYFDKKKIRLQKSTFSKLDRLEEGEKMHKVIQIFIKGCGRSCNVKYMENQVLGSNDFRYFPEYTINTIYYVIAKQMIQGKYVTISSEKWMRKTTKKQFRRYDLILRNQDSACVLDWKFSTNTAQVLLNSRKMERKNKEYYELARKQYKTEVKLKYIVMTPEFQDNYHKYKVAQYTYQTQQVQVEDSEIQEDDSCIIQYEVNPNKGGQKDDGQKNNAKKEIEQQRQKKNAMDQIRSFQKQIRQKQIETKRLKNNSELSKASDVQPEKLNSDHNMEIEHTKSLGYLQTVHYQSDRLKTNELFSTLTKSKSQKPNFGTIQAFSSPKQHQKLAAQQVQKDSTGGSKQNQQRSFRLQIQIEDDSQMEEKERLPLQRKSQQVNPKQQEKQHSRDQKYAKYAQEQREQHQQKNLKMLLAKSKQQKLSLIREAYEDYLNNYQRKKQIQDQEKVSNIPFKSGSQVQEEEKKKRLSAKQPKINRNQSDFKQCIDLESLSEYSEQDFDISMSYKKDHLDGKKAHTKVSLRPQNGNSKQLKQTSQYLKNAQTQIKNAQNQLQNAQKQLKNPQKMNAVIELSDQD